MKRTLFLIIGMIVCALVLMTASPAGADNGPHGGYTATTVACAGCHRAHTAAGPALLVQTSTYALCMSCHGSTGTGADTNVEDGLYLNRDSVSEAPAQGVDGLALKGGGFVNGTMDTDVDLVSVPAAISSSHLADGSTALAWGNGAIGSGPGLSNFSMSCATCHNPHGRASTTNTATYRILRAIPTGSGGSGVNVSEQASKIYSVGDSDNQYYGENYGLRAQQLSNWCSQCHTRYLAPSASGHTNSGDPIFAYRHQTNSSAVGCMNCHVAHGTTASMGPLSGALVWPDGAVIPNGSDRSSLLRVDNRGVCELCHGK